MRKITKTIEIQFSPAVRMSHRQMAVNKETGFAINRGDDSFQSFVNRESKVEMNKKIPTWISARVAQKRSTNIVLGLLGFMLVAAFFVGENTAWGQRIPRRILSPETGPAFVPRIAAGASGQVSGLIRPGDEVWLISTRWVTTTSLEQGQQVICDLDVRQRIDRNWVGQSVLDLTQRVAGDAIRENIFFVHGNRTDLQWAERRGLEMYEAVMGVEGIAGQVGLDFAPNELPPIRWIIWAWPSDIVPGPKRDLEIKRHRAIEEGQILAEILQRIERPQVGIIAYSLGAQALVASFKAFDHHGQHQVLLQDGTASTPSGTITPSDTITPSGTITPPGTLLANPAASQPEPEPETEERHMVIDLQSIQEVFTGLPLASQSGEEDSLSDVLATSDTAIATPGTTGSKNSDNHSLHQTSRQLRDLLGPNPAAVENRMDDSAARLVVQQQALVALNLEQPKQVRVPLAAGPRLRIVMIAAAIPACWLNSPESGSLSGMADRLTLINNPRDRVLNVYRKITKSPALGAASQVPWNEVPIELHLLHNNHLDNHILSEYLLDESTRAAIRRGLFDL